MLECCRRFHMSTRPMHFVLGSRNPKTKMNECLILLDFQMTDCEFRYDDTEEKDPSYSFHNKLLCHVDPLLGNDCETQHDNVHY
jgi:hypothetical protein